MNSSLSASRRAASPGGARREATDAGGNIRARLLGIAVVVLTLVVIGASGLYAGGRITTLSTAARSTRIAGHARAIEQMWTRVAADGAYGIDARLAAIADGDRVHAAIVHPNGTVLAAHPSTEWPRTVEDPDVLSVLYGADRQAGRTRVAGAPPVQYVEPMTLDDVRHALVVRERSSTPAGLSGVVARQGARDALTAAAAFAVLLRLLWRRPVASAHQQVDDGRDPLTGLRDHAGYQDALRALVDQVRRAGFELSLLLIDVDDFKAHNDRWGHQYGDQLLAGIGRVLADYPVGGHAFRVGGDDFAVILPYVGVHAATTTASRLRVKVAEAVAGVTISVGVGSLGADVEDVEVLASRAEAALQETRHSGRSGVAAFDATRQTAAIVDSASQLALRRLLDEQRLHTVFQPIFRSDGAGVLAYEALSRPPAGCGLPGPKEMFDTAERISRVHDLDALCRRSAFASARTMPPHALLFVNIYPEALDHPSLSDDALLGDLAAAGLRPGRVVLEITERDVVRREMVVREARRLRRLGFLIALDDAGAGNAGLEMLRNLPVDFVKVDRDVLEGALSDPGARGVLHALVAYAGQTGSAVIFEGIETGEQLALIDRLRDGRDVVDGLQGYLLARPQDGFAGAEPAAAPTAS